MRFKKMPEPVGSWHVSEPFFFLHEQDQETGRLEKANAITLKGLGSSRWVESRCFHGFIQLKKNGSERQNLSVTNH